MIWEMLAIWAISFIISVALAPSPNIQEPSPARLRDLRLPTTDAQRPIPVVFGRVLVRDPNLVWYGDFRVVEIEEEVDTGPFSSKDVVVGYRYYLGYHYVVCHSTDAAPTVLRQIRIEDNVIPVQDIEAEEGTLAYAVQFLSLSFSGGSTTTALSGAGRYILWAPGLWGGHKKGGGVSGPVAVLDGNGTQEASQYLVDQLGEPQPGYRGVLSMAAEQVYIGESPILKPHQFLVERYPDPASTGQYVQVQGDANPAWVILEAIVDRDWGLGYALARADIASFTAAAEQLHLEDHGFSHEWQRQSEVEDFIRLVLQQIDASLFDDPVTGLWRLKLIRDDYVFDDLPILDRSNILEVNEHGRPTLGELPSEVTVIWTDRDQANDQRVIVHNLGVAAAQGGQVVAKTIQHPGISRAALANVVAERELSGLSRPLVKTELTVHSDVGINLRPGDPVRWQWPEYGIADLVLRVGQIDYGELTRSVVRVVCVEDVFREGVGIYAPPPSTQWQPVALPPAPVTDWRAEPTTHWQLEADDFDWSPLGSSETSVTVWAGAPTGNSQSYALDLQQGSDWARRAAEAAFAWVGSLSAGITAAQTDCPVSIDPFAVFSLQAGQLVWLDGELCRLDAQELDQGRLVLARGCADTVARAHTVGSPLYVISRSSRPALQALSAGDNATVRIITSATTGEIDLADAPQRTESNVPARHLLPYPPGRLRIESNAYPDYLTGELSLAWAHRDRLAQAGELVDESVASRGPEAGVTYTLRLYGETDTLLRTESGLTGMSYGYADEAADSGLAGGRRNNLVRLELEAERDTLTSWTQHDVTTRRVGYGYSYGHSYGGL